MGALLSQLKQSPNIKTNCTLLNTSLSKLREFHGSFKSICDNFSIDLTEFEQIFGANETSFNIWDTDNNGLIDALELFSGLILFSDAKFEDKIRFLFDLFDFNELNSLAPIDIEFMMHCCLTSTYKIYGISSEINEEEITKYVTGYFLEDVRINISQLLKWCTKSQEIHDYFMIIKREAPVLKHNTINTLITPELTQKLQATSNNDQSAKRYSDYKMMTHIINHPKFEKKQEYLSNLMAKTNNNSKVMSEINARDTVAKLSWVYGFRSDDVKRPLQYLGSGQGKAINEKLIFFSSSIAIVYYPKSNEQFHYIEHNREIISLAVSSSSNLVATGELGEWPSLHVWDCNSLQNISVIKGLHQNGIHLITFLRGDELIVSCGIRSTSPIFIHNFRDGNLIISTYVNEFAVDLGTIYSYVGEHQIAHDKIMSFRPNSQVQNKEIITTYRSNTGKSNQDDNMFYVCTQNKIIIYEYTKGNFTSSEILISQLDITSPITCCWAMKINTLNPALKAYASETERGLIILTGHKDGRLLIWENYEFKQELMNYKYEILAICSFDGGIVIATDSSHLYFWDIGLKFVIKDVDLCSLPFKLFSFKISSVISAGQKIFFCTLEGDVVELGLSLKREINNNKAGSTHRIIAKRINNVSKFNGTLRSLAIIEKPDDTIIFTAGENGIVYAFSTENHEILDVWSFGESIKALDCTCFEDGGNVFAIGSASGKIHLRFDWEEVPRYYDCMSSIIEVKFSHDSCYLAAAAEDCYVYIFQLVNNTYFNNQIKKISFENECPISLNFSDDNKFMLIGTSQRNHYTIDLSDINVKNINNQTEKIDFSLLNVKYAAHTKNFMNNLQPMAFGMGFKAVITADDTGVIFFWKDKEGVESNCGTYLKGHTSQIATFAETRYKDMFFSIGTNDHTVLEWKLELIIDDNSDESEDVKKQNEIYDEVILRELNYSYSVQQTAEKFRDSMVFFRGTTQKMLNAMNFDTLPAFEEDKLIIKRIPPISLKLQYVYGMQAYEKRKTLYYAHYYSLKHQKADDKTNEKKSKGPTNIDLLSRRDKLQEQQDKEANLLLPTYLQDQLLFSKQTPVPYDTKHEACERHFVYFISRIAIIYSPLTNEQRFYEGHKNKITAIAMHPSKMLVASGESSLNPCIHIWTIFTLEPTRVLKTFHKNGIANLTFSSDGVFLVSIGMDTYFSIQVTNWKNDEVLSYRNSHSSPILDVVFNTYNKYQFATCGYYTISIWELTGKSLNRKEWIQIKESDKEQFPFFTSIAYINYHLGNDIDSDLVVGNNFGDIGLITCGKYFTLRHRAHSKMINCIKVTDMIPEKVMIITTAEDEYLKIWDSSFNLIYDINIRKTGFFDDIPISKNLSIQSIDIYICRSALGANTTKIGQKSQRDQQPVGDKDVKPLILIGTRNGDILEAQFTTHFGGIRTHQMGGLRRSLAHIEKEPPRSTPGMKSDDEDESQSGSENESSQNESKNNTTIKSKDNSTQELALNFSLHCRNHSGSLSNYANIYNKRLLFAMHPIFNIYASIGEDMNLMLWDTEKCKLIAMRNLGLIPTAIKFTPDGDLLAIGFINGTLMMLDSKITSNTFGKFTENYVLPSFESMLTIIDKENKAPILNIEFSSKGEMMAVSYDNQNTSKENEDKIDKEGSYVVVFISRISPRYAKVRSNDKNLYHKYTDIRNPSLYETFQSENNVFGRAVYYMNFSQDENYLLIYYQIVDNYQIRVNDDQQGIFVVWDLNTNTSVKNWDSLKNIQWKKLNFPNSVFGQYMEYNNLLSNEDVKKETILTMKNLTLTAMHDLNPFIIVGSANGEMHSFKVNALHFDKDFLIENLKQSQMCMSKTYSAHISFINQCEVHSKTDVMLTTGIYDECILQWKLIQEEDYWDLEFLEFDNKQQDMFAELPAYDKFVNLIAEILPLRNEIHEIQQNLDEITEPEIDLKLEAVIGRKAYNRRANLFYDYENRIIYSIGSMIVIMDSQKLVDESDSESIIKQDDIDELNGCQEFLRVDSESIFSTSPEISTFAISQDKKFLCAGTVELKAKLIIWEIYSRTCLKTLKLANCSIIQNIKFAYDSRHICCVGISPQYTQIVYLIDSQIPQILGCINMMNTLPFKIKELDFFPNSIYKFLTVGVQHISVWNYCGGVLSFSSCEIENPKDLVNLKAGILAMNQELVYKEDEMKENNNDYIPDIDDDIPSLQVSFYSMCFVHNTIVTGGNDGFIYIWHDNQIRKKQTAHPKAPVLCLSSLKNSNSFVSGGMDGRIIIWELSKSIDGKSYIIEKFYEYSLTNEELNKVLINYKYHVQSVCISTKSILVGTRSGDIYELNKPRESELKAKDNIAYENMVMQRLACHDNEIPKAVAFSNTSDRIYCITQKGFFNVWEIKTLKVVHSKIYARSTVGMINFKNKQLLLIAFEHEVLMLNTEKKAHFSFIPTYQLKSKSQITDVKLSFNEKKLAIAIAPDAETNAKIDLYEVDTQTNTFKLLASIENVNSSINFIDFSTDNFYLLYKDNFEEITIIDLTNFKKFNNLHVSEFEIEWVSDGMLIHEKTEGILKYYPDENKILKMVKITQDTIAVTDEMGTIRLFNYPCDIGSTYGYHKCYTDHLNYINTCILSSDKRYMLTSSEVDRSIFLWRVIKTADKTPQIMIQ